jgi:hypothetical protein
MLVYVSARKSLCSAVVSKQPWGLVLVDRVAGCVYVCRRCRDGSVDLGAFSAWLPFKTVAIWPSCSALRPPSQMSSSCIKTVAFAMTILERMCDAVKYSPMSRNHVMSDNCWKVLPAMPSLGETVRHHCYCHRQDGTRPSVRSPRGTLEQAWYCHMSTSAEDLELCLLEPLMFPFVSLDCAQFRQT